MMNSLANSVTSISVTATLPYNKRQYYTNTIIKLPHQTNTYHFYPSHSMQFSPTEWLKMKALAVRKNKLNEFKDWQRSKFIRLEY